MALPVPLPVRHSCKAPHFNPACPSTLQDYLYNYELLAEAAQLTPAEQLAKCTCYLERDIRMDWETLPEFKAMPPDWKAFKAALFRDYPDARDPEPSLVDLDKFIKEHSHWSILSLSEFASFNQQFRRLTYFLLASNCVCRLEVQKAYTKSIDPELLRLIHIYLVTEKVPHIMGEPYTVEQVREAAEYVFEGNDPCFEILGQINRLQDLTEVPQLFCATDKAAEQQQTDQLLQDVSTLVAEEVEKGLTYSSTRTNPVSCPRSYLCASSYYGPASCPSTRGSGVYHSPNPC